MLDFRDQLPESVFMPSELAKHQTPGLDVSVNAWLVDQNNGLVEAVTVKRFRGSCDDWFRRTDYAELLDGRIVSSFYLFPRNRRYQKPKIVLLKDDFGDVRQWVSIPYKMKKTGNKAP